MDTLVLIPAYKPDEALIGAVVDLYSKGYRILVVDDGGGSAYDPIFKLVSRFAIILRKKQNHGKGAALKSGFRYIRENMPDVEYIITADADGQHKPSDIAKVDAALHDGKPFVIGSREFVGEVPIRSLLGNKITRAVFAAVSHVRVADTQTGLRGFSRELLDWLCDVPGYRYEYEMNMLLDAAKNKIDISEVIIETVYEKGNPSSHFDPVKDSAKIYKCIFNYALNKGSGTDADD